MNVTVSAEAVESHVSCNNDIVSVPERGRIDVVTRSLIVKVGVFEMLSFRPPLFYVSACHNVNVCPSTTGWGRWDVKDTQLAPLSQR